MEGFTIQKLGKIRNKWVTDFISETLATFLFTVSDISFLKKNPKQTKKKPTFNTQSCLSTTLKKKSFENIVGKGEKCW